MDNTIAADITAAEFAKVVALESAKAAAITICANAAAVGILLGTGYAYSKLQDRRAKKAAQKTVIEHES